MRPTKTIICCKTGDVSVVELTDEEIAYQKEKKCEEAPSPFEAELAALRKEIEELKADRK